MYKSLITRTVTLKVWQISQGIRVRNIWSFEPDCIVDTWYGTLRILCIVGAECELCIHISYIPDSCTSRILSESPIRFGHQFLDIEGSNLRGLHQTAASDGTVADLLS